MPPRRQKLTTAQVAERLGIEPPTWRSYVSRGKAPAADGHHDKRTPWWWSTTIDRHIADHTRADPDPNL